ncbi:AAA domain-containing protein [Saccharopolyspora sp. NPDC049426]|uniref:AAA domain-containing protein n=1 Tax=Saccharopolyspora sp. NPDC049426 TaxID=3155652 RepID=UPI00343FB82E
MASAGGRASEALQKSTSLVDYLAELMKSARRNPLYDISSSHAKAPETLIWLDELPPGITASRTSDETLLKVHSSPSKPVPTIPVELHALIDMQEAGEPTGPEPKLRNEDGSPFDADARADGPQLRRNYDVWLARWRAWAEEEHVRRRRRTLYEQLETAARKLEQQDDEFEFVIAVGLYGMRTKNGQNLFRHVLVEQAVPTLDKSGAISVSRVPGKRRLEDRELFDRMSEYRPDRARDTKKEILEGDDPITAGASIQALRKWAATALDCPIAESEARVGDGSAVPEQLTFSPAPALLLQPRTQALVADAYQHIGEQLRRPGAPVPVGLSQLVLDTEPAERNGWLTAQGADHGDVLGADPLFPLAANAEQSRVLELLRTETGVVVQGPPGTGKTHTIANLVSALLAQGQRVLVTSQKDQALRVLREKIPDEVRKLCVLLTGGSKDAAIEFERGLEALSQAVASTDVKSLAKRSAVLQQERDRLRKEAVALNNKIADLRQTEQADFPPVAPNYSPDQYRGTLAEIVGESLVNRDKHQWMPDVPSSAQDVPPLSADDLVTLRNLLAARTENRAQRLNQEIPGPADLPSPSELAGHVRDEEVARQAAEEAANGPSKALVALPEPALEFLERLLRDAENTLRQCGYLPDEDRFEPDWANKAVRDRLAGRHGGLWSHLHEVRSEPEQLQSRLRSQGTGYVIDKPEITQANLGQARGWLRDGKLLLEHFRAGGTLRRFARSKAQKAAQDLLDTVKVDGAVPSTTEQLSAVLDRIEAEIAVMQLADKWSDVGVVIEAGQVTVVLSALADHFDVLHGVDELGKIFDLTAETLRDNRIDLTMPDLPTFLNVLRSVPAAKRQLKLEAARKRVDALYRRVDEWAKQPLACPELASLLISIGDRDPERYAHLLTELETARTERDDEIRCEKLLRTLRAVHPELADMWSKNPADPRWHERDVRAAWAWSKADQFVRQRRDADEERRLTDEFDRTEDRLNHVTEELAATEAMHKCLTKMSEDHVRALNAYRAHISNIGAGTGSKVREFRRAARVAMSKAQDAVPAWVVPLPNLLENISPQRDRFDVVIVDEASQVGIEHLYLLWMAPRVIVVGDDKQCTPGSGAMGRLDTAFAQLDEHLADIPEDIRRIYTPKSHLYEVLSARSGKNALIRLREHFRCVPEIIKWPSDQFYDDGSGQSGLIALREREQDALPALKVTHVDNAVTSGRETRIKNETEAQEIVTTLRKCVDDPAYHGKSFGVVVLRNATAHIQYLEKLIHDEFSPEERHERTIRVGTAPNFQGDERDVVMLSFVVAEPPNRIGAESYRQAFNVAASRARDQMWLFTSLRPEQFKLNDLRLSLLSYMLNPPSAFGKSPTLDEVLPNQPHKSFDSLFEQRVFLALKQRGYHVVPQYPVGSRRLDLVVVGDNGRLAVECDGTYWHSSVEQQDNDARRDRELKRMKWTTIRVRESEYVADPERELERVWGALRVKGIEPGHREDGAGEWKPVDLDNDEDEETP